MEHNRHDPSVEPTEAPPAPAPPTPLDPPRIYFSVFDRLAPRVIFTQERAGTLDPKHWVYLELPGVTPQDSEPGEQGIVITEPANATV